jgi:hypothetical protein
VERYDCTGVWERVSRNTNTHASESRTSSPHPWTRIFLGSARNDECKHAATVNREAATVNGDTATVNGDTATVNGDTITANGETATVNREAVAANRNLATANRQMVTANRQTVTANRRLLQEAIIPVDITENNKKCVKFCTVWNTSGESPTRAGGKNTIMSQDFLPDGDTQLKNWLDNFVVKCELYETQLDLTAGELLSIASGATSFNSALNTTTSLKDELKGAVADKAKKKSDVSSLVRTYARQWKANPAIPPTILGALGITSSSTSGPVVTVSGLTINACGYGVNQLKWNRTGNAPGTIFFIESRLAGSSTWRFVAAVTRTNYNDEGQTPGQAQYYRITSIRAGVNSNPCLEVGVYTGSGDGDTELTIAA